MKKLLISTAVLLVGLQGAAQAVSDERILEVMKAGMSNVNALCTKLNQLPPEDQNRLGSLSFNPGETDAQKEIVKLIDENMSLHRCVNKLGTTQPGW